MSRYKPGEIWEDNDEDKWEVTDNGYMRVLPDGLAFQRNERVEDMYGPLHRVHPVENITPSDPEGLGDPHGMLDPVVKFNEPYVSPDTWEKAAIEYSREAWTTAGDLDDVYMIQVVSDVARRLDKRFVQDVFRVYEEVLRLLLKKNADYGSRNIAESPGGALNGLRVRMWDKIARINNLIDSGVEPENESLRDSFVDLLNYSAIALMVLDGNWPGTEET